MEWESILPSPIEAQLRRKAHWAGALFRTPHKHGRGSVQVYLAFLHNWSIFSAYHKTSTEFIFHIRSCVVWCSHAFLRNKTLHILIHPYTYYALKSKRKLERRAAKQAKQKGTNILKTWKYEYKNNQLINNVGKRL